jgi:predicted transposase/invertase (TIGR01784 family)
VGYYPVLFLIKNMHKMDKESIPYKEGKYNDLFEASEIGSMAQEDIVLYSQSRTKMLQDQRAIEYAEARGEAKGRAEGRAEGISEANAATAKKLFAAGLPRDFIKEITGVDILDL